VDRTTDFEHGLPFHEARRDGNWEPDPLARHRFAAALPDALIPDAVGTSYTFAAAPARSHAAR
jgi:hypothetical protein